MVGRAATRWEPASLERLRLELGRAHAEVVREVDQTIRRPHPSAALLHDLHRDMRRLTGALSVWSPLLLRSDQEVLRPSVRRLKRLARLVGRVRDKDVTLALVERTSTRLPGAGGSLPLRAFRGRLRDDARTGRELLRAFLRTERDAGLFEHLRATLGRPRRRVAQPEIARLLSAEKGERYGRLKKAHSKARRDPTVTRLHRLRIRIRQWHHLSGLLRIFDRANHVPITAELRRLQDRLGMLHDLDIALSSLPPDLRGTGLASQLRLLRRRTRRAIEGTLGTLDRELATALNPIAGD